MWLCFLFQVTAFGVDIDIHGSLSHSQYFTITVCITIMYNTQFSQSQLMNAPHERPTSLHDSSCYCFVYSALAFTLCVCVCVCVCVCDCHSCTCTTVRNVLYKLPYVLFSSASRSAFRLWRLFASPTLSPSVVTTGALARLFEYVLRAFAPLIRNNMYITTVCIRA